MAACRKLDSWTCIPSPQPSRCTPSAGNASLPFLTQLQLHAPTHPQATYYTFSDAEEKLIMRGQRQGMAAVLDSPEVRWGTSRLPDCRAWECACCCGHSLLQHGRNPCHSRRTDLARQDGWWFACRRPPQLWFALLPSNCHAPPPMWQPHPNYRAPACRRGAA